MKEIGWLLIPVLAFAFLDWASTWKGWKKRLYLAKPAVVILLALWTYLATGWQNGMLWFGIGLLFSLVGDVFLMLGPSLLMPGLAAFVFTQISYLIGFNQTPIEFSFPVATAAVIVGLTASGVFRIIRPGIEAKFKKRRMLVPVFIYFAVLTLMTLSALLTLMRPDWIQPSSALAAAGGVLFFTSDSLLSYNRFVKPLPHAATWVHLTYHLGQLGIIIGAVLHFTA